MVASFALIRSSGYYTRESSAARYYDAGAEASGTWLRGSSRLGILVGSAVEPAVFDRACQGLDRQGRLLVNHTHAGRRTFGTDITLSSPKAVSVIWALGDDAMRNAIAEAEREAVEAALGLIESEIPLARRGHAGARREKAAFAAAVFTHSESRPELHADGTVMPSPQRHHHLCLPSIGQRADGSWGALDTVALRSWKKAIGAEYRLALASALQQRGLEIEAADDHWRWSVRGVPQALCRFFSARRAAIEEDLAGSGVTSAAAPALAAAVTLAGRRDKEAIAQHALIQIWKDAATALGHAPQAVLASARAEGQAAIDKSRDRKALVADRLSSLPEALTEHSATFERRHLVELVANALVGTRASPGQSVEHAGGMVRGGRIAVLGERRGEVVLSTPEMIAVERRLVALARRLASERIIAPSRTLVNELVSDQGLNVEQAGVVDAATSGRRLTLIQGAAGTGKSTTLAAISRAWQAQGFTVVGAAIAWRASHGLRDDLGITSRAIDAWLARSDGRSPVFGPKTCLLIEEGGLQASPQALRLLAEIDRAGGVAVVVGDEHQLRPIGPGHAMRLIREAVGAAEIKTVVRQREAWAREAPQAFARGEGGVGLEAFATRGLVHFHESPRATVAALADEWQRRRDASPDAAVLITAKTNAEVRAVSAALRLRLRDRGVLSGPDIEIEAVDASGNGHTLKLAAGDRVRFLDRRDGLGVVNGTEAQIVAVQQLSEGLVSILARVGDRSIAFAPSDVSDGRGRAKLAHAYAATIFQAQGMTVDTSLVLASARFDRHDAYVAASRARGNTSFFVDGRALDREIAADTTEPVRVGDRDSRLRFLARRLGRANAKTTTLDLLAPPPERLRAETAQRIGAHHPEFRREPTREL